MHRGCLRHIQEIVIGYTSEIERGEGWGGKRREINYLFNNLLYYLTFLQVCINCTINYFN